MNTCNKCQVTKYCNAVCKKVHKKKHKKDCEEHIRLATEKRNEELRIAAELHDIELFKQPPAAEDCPICSLRIPTYIQGIDINHAVGKLYVVDVFMHLYMITRVMKLIIKSALYAELHILKQTRR